MTNPFAATHAEVREVRKSYRRGPEKVHALAGVTLALSEARWWR
jgi:hypothetical protein